MAAENSSCVVTLPIHANAVPKQVRPRGGREKIPDEIGALRNRKKGARARLVRVLEALATLASAGEIDGIAFVVHGRIEAAPWVKTLAAGPRYMGEKESEEWRAAVRSDLMRAAQIIGEAHDA